MLGGRLSKGKGSSEPKLCDVKTPADFVAAYLRVPLKHAYEVIDDVRGCHPFLDLPIHSSAEYEAACPSALHSGIQCATLGGGPERRRDE